MLILTVFRLTIFYMRLCSYCNDSLSYYLHVLLHFCCHWRDKQWWRFIL